MVVGSGVSVQLGCSTPRSRICVPVSVAISAGTTILTVAASWKTSARVDTLLVAVVFVLMLAVCYLALNPVRPFDSTPVRPASAETVEVASNRLGVVLIVGTSATGGGACSGVPVKGTQMVISAAHCLTDRKSTNELFPNLWIRDPGSGMLLAAVVAVRFDHRHFDTLEPRYDLAVLHTDRVWPSGVDAVEPLRTPQDVTVHALQVVRAHGWYLVAGNEEERIAVMECSARDLPVPALKDGMFNLPCGLVPGASGSPVVADIDGSSTLVGVLSTVSSNGDNGIGAADGLLPLIAGETGIYAEVRSSQLPELAHHRQAVDSWWRLVELIDFVETRSSMGATVLRGAVPAWRGNVLELHLPPQVRNRLEVASEKFQDRFFTALEEFGETTGAHVTLVGVHRN
jgi:hypothetical protein